MSLQCAVVSLQRQLNAKARGDHAKNFRGLVRFALTLLDRAQCTLNRSAIASRKSHTSTHHRTDRVYLFFVVAHESPPLKVSTGARTGILPITLVRAPGLVNPALPEKASSALPDAPSFSQEASRHSSDYVREQRRQMNPTYPASRSDRYPSSQALDDPWYTAFRCVLFSIY